MRRPLLVLVVLALLAGPTLTWASGRPGIWSRHSRPSGHGFVGGWSNRSARHSWDGYMIRQGYESYSGSPWQGYDETICVPIKEAMPDQYTFIHPSLGPGYLCRTLQR